MCKRCETNRKTTAKPIVNMPKSSPRQGSGGGSFKIPKPKR